MFKTGIMDLNFSGKFLESWVGFAPEVTIHGGVFSRMPVFRLHQSRPKEQNP